MSHNVFVYCLNEFEEILKPFTNKLRHVKFAQAQTIRRWHNYGTFGSTFKRKRSRLCTFMYAGVTIVPPPLLVYVTKKPF